jgi:chlorophyll/bacteriochlorophyll a synthase
MQESVVSNKISPNIVRTPAMRDVVRLTKPITWFPPIWAFMCGVVSSGGSIADNWIFCVAGIALTGPLVCGTSQVINDYCDRHVDAINEPDRPIPSGRVPGRWPVWIALIGAALSLALSAALGNWVLLATLIALFFGWAYSAPPFRFKRSGWLGPLVCAFSYEGLSWFTGASVMLGDVPSSTSLAIILLYSLGAHGIMTLNDFKAIKGDAFACGVMGVAQLAVMAILLLQALWPSAAIVALLLAIQCGLMIRLVGDPAKFAPWYNATGVLLYVLGMLATALGLGGYI